MIAVKHRGPTEINNLALACSHCNRHKGPNIAGFDPETRALSRLYDPRTDEWEAHFELHANGVIAGLTPVARTTILVLDMNESDSVALRASLIVEGVLVTSAG